MLKDECGSNSTGNNAEKKNNCREDCKRSQSEDGADILGISIEENSDPISKDHGSAQPDHGEEDMPFNKGSQKATGNSDASCESDSEEEALDIWMRYMEDGKMAS